MGEHVKLFHFSLLRESVDVVVARFTVRTGTQIFIVIVRVHVVKVILVTYEALRSLYWCVRRRIHVVAQTKKGLEK